MGVVQVLISLSVGFILVQLYGLFTNYRNARRTGLKVLIAPVYQYGVFWHLTQSLCVSFIRKLPEPLNDWCRTVHTAWLFQDGDRMIRKYGAAFIVVSPSRNMLVTSDPQAINTVLAKRKDFIKPKIYGMVTTIEPRCQLLTYLQRR